MAVRGRRTGGRQSGHPWSAALAARGRGVDGDTGPVAQSGGGTRVYRWDVDVDVTVAPRRSTRTTATTTAAWWLSMSMAAMMMESLDIDEDNKLMRMTATMPSSVRYSMSMLATMRMR